MADQRKKERHSSGNSSVLIIVVIILAVIVISMNGVLLYDYLLPQTVVNDYPEGDLFNQFPSQDIDEILSSVKGRIPVLEYHTILTPNVESNLVATGKIKINKKNKRFFVKSAEFRRHLETLYQERFRNISIDEYLSLQKGTKKDLDRLPPDCKLYVLTFDDAALGQFDFLGTNNKGDAILDPDCAVGIMLDFARKHPDFKLNAAFSVDFENAPFHQERYVKTKLNLLMDYGFEIINHTANHKRLSRYIPGNSNIATYEIGKAMELFESYLGYRAGAIDKICYPDGGANPDVFKFVQKIAYNGKIYKFRAALDATGYQSRNPNDRLFNIYNISRIEINDKTFSPLIVKADGLYKTPSLEDRIFNKKMVRVDLTFQTNISEEVPLSR